MLEHEAESQYDEFLDDVYQSVTIAGVEYFPSNIVKTDGPAYREGFNNWTDSEGIEIQ